MTCDRVAELRAMLQPGRRWRKLNAIEEAALAHGAAVELVPDIVVFLTSYDCVHVEVPWASMHVAG